jgi:hypothetical protein
VRARAAHLARLIRAFHEFKALKTLRKMGRQGTQRRRACQYESAFESLAASERENDLCFALEIFRVRRPAQRRRDITPLASTY